MLVDDTLWRDATELSRKIGRRKLKETYWSAVGNLCARGTLVTHWLYLGDAASHEFTPEEKKALERIARLRYAEFFEEER